MCWLLRHNQLSQDILYAQRAIEEIGHRHESPVGKEHVFVGCGPADRAFVQAQDPRDLGARQRAQVAYSIF